MVRSGLLGLGLAARAVISQIFDGKRSGANLRLRPLVEA